MTPGIACPHCPQAGAASLQQQSSRAVSSATTAPREHWKLVGFKTCLSFFLFHSGHKCQAATFSAPPTPTTKFLPIILLDGEENSVHEVLYRHKTKKDEQDFLAQKYIDGFGFWGVFCLVGWLIFCEFMAVSVNLPDIYNWTWKYCLLSFRTLFCIHSCQKFLLFEMETKPCYTLQLSVLWLNVRSSWVDTEAVVYRTAWFRDTFWFYFNCPRAPEL